MKIRGKEKLPRAGFTLVELAWIIGIVIVLALVLFPVFARRPHERSRDVTCQSNEKQIGLAILQYIQDYDEHYPLAYITPASHAGDGSVVHNLTYEAEVYPYTKTYGVFHCPDVPKQDSSEPQSDYRYNDLLANDSGTDPTKDADQRIVTPSFTVMVMDSDALSNNIGHAWTPNEPAHPAILNGRGGCDVGRGATVQYAPTRHNGGAMYLFADGHVKFLLTSFVFFPPLQSPLGTHKNADGIAIGPDPGGDMTFAGTTYRATFHLR